MKILIAVPSANPGGLDAAMGQHFGHCEVFTLANVDEDGKITDVEALPNPPHTEGGCTAPVQMLAARGVKVMLAGGMGMRPLMAFHQAGIKVFYSGPIMVVREAIEALIAGKLPEFTENNSCQHHHEGGSCGHH